MKWLPILNAALQLGLVIQGVSELIHKNTPDATLCFVLVLLLEVIGKKVTP